MSSGRAGGEAGTAGAGGGAARRAHGIGTGAAARATGWACGAAAGATGQVPEEQEQREMSGRCNGRGHGRRRIEKQEQREASNKRERM
jgi:hypothetical protein